MSISFRIILSKLTYCRPPALSTGAYPGQVQGPYGETRPQYCVKLIVSVRNKRASDTPSFQGVLEEGWKHLVVNMVSGDMFSPPHTHTQLVTSLLLLG